jgi:hypothetical protein
MIKMLITSYLSLTLDVQLIESFTGFRFWATNMVRCECRFRRLLVFKLFELTFPNTRTGAEVRCDVRGQQLHGFSHGLRGHLSLVLPPQEQSYIIIIASVFLLASFLKFFHKQELKTLCFFIFSKRTFVVCIRSFGSANPDPIVNWKLYLQYFPETNCYGKCVKPFLHISTQGVGTIICTPRLFSVWFLALF